MLADMGDRQVGAHGIGGTTGWRLFTGLLCKDPPYGSIRGIDLATGERLCTTRLARRAKREVWGPP